MTTGEPPRRPGKVVGLVLAFWIAGTVMQTAFAWLVGSSGMVEPSSAVRIGQVLGWGLLCVVSFYYRKQLDVWLRS